MEYLPQEILGDVLLRLPVASLMRLCCVSKKLNDFIHGSFFVDLHYSHTQNSRGRRVLLLKGSRSRSRWWDCDDYRTKTRLSICPLDLDHDDDDDGNEFASVDLPLPFRSGFVVRLFGSCRGIACISVCSSLYLCNPTTRKVLTLPTSSFASNYAITHGIGLGFDSSSENYRVIRLVWFLGALNLDASTVHHDFEVSSLLTHNPSAEALETLETLQTLETLGQGSTSSSRGILSQGWPTLGAEMYNLNTNSWRKLDVVLPHIDEKNSAAVLNGRYFHWCTKHRRILSFDMKTQTFCQMEIPGDDAQLQFGANRLAPTWNVGVLDDSLAFLFLSPMHVEVWVMEGYGMMEQSWIKRYSMGSPVPSISISSISCWNDGRLFMVSDEELISCCLQNDSNGEIKTYGVICRAPNYSLSYLVYQESLVSLYRGHKGMLWRRM